MFKTLSLAGAALALGATALLPATPAAAQSYGHYDEYRGGYDNGGYGGGYRGGDDRGGYDRAYDNGGYRQGYAQDGRYYDQQAYRHDYRRNPCRTGGAGTIIGAIAGGLFGSAVAGRGDHTLGAVIGAGAGALAGNAVEKGNRPDYCRR